MKEGDLFYDEITQNDLVVLCHETEYIGGNLAGDKNYGQLFFFLKHTNEDLDNAIFREPWKSENSRKKEYFFQYIPYHMFDHHPL